VFAVAGVVAFEVAEDPAIREGRPPSVPAAVEVEVMGLAGSAAAGGADAAGDAAAGLALLAGAALLAGFVWAGGGVF